ncbi:hypothetical protein [Yeosuana sp.]|uniref:hypothetical protein n=1 Tax=Yeosuana sp. TaxID=2529388 RepID=UPI004054F846
MELTDDVMKKVILIEGENKFKYDDIKANTFMSLLLKYYFLTMSEYEFNKKLKNNEIILETDKRLNTIKIIS